MREKLEVEKLVGLPFRCRKIDIVYSPVNIRTKILFGFKILFLLYHH